MANADYLHVVLSVCWYERQPVLAVRPWQGTAVEAELRMTASTATQ
jgi:hypothetical protein